MVSENGMDKECREQTIVLNKPSASYRTSSLKVQFSVWRLRKKHIVRD